MAGKLDEEETGGNNVFMMGRGRTTWKQHTSREMERVGEVKAVQVKIT
jgi:hypothetical protein